MADIYVYDKDCRAFDNFGLVGALAATECRFKEDANGMSEITLKHPLDAFGRYTALEVNNKLIASVPVRTTPQIQDGSIVTAVEKWSVSATATRAQQTLYRYSSGGGALRVLPAGLELTVVGKLTEDGMYCVKSMYGSGWMYREGLKFEYSQTIEDNSQSIESVEPAWTIKPQIFRIYKVEKNIDSVTVSARHITYDLLYNLTTYKNIVACSCREALAGIMDNCIAPHDFTAYTNLDSQRTYIDWTRINPISALLDPENGLTTLYNAALVRDNWELYVLHDPGLNRGVTVEYGKNMTGIKYSESFESVVTRVVPVGETQDGEPLLLYGDTPWVDSPRIRDYPIIYTQELKCEDCKIDAESGVTAAIAWTRMLEQAQAVFDEGGDLPQVEISVDFINLGDAEEYKQYKNLERLFLWDYVLIRHKLQNIDVTARVVSVEWDCILDQMTKMEVGSVGKTLANSGITTWQIPDGFSGSKIAAQTVGNAALKDSIIAARHMQAESINTKALQAESVTAEKLAAGAITADKIDTETLNAASINAVTAKIESLTASDITTDRLAAALAAFTVITAGTAEFDRATVQHLVAQALNLSFGTADDVFIENLRVAYGQMAQATIGNLCIKASDGKYYRIDVTSGGNVTAMPVSVSEGEINAGQTDDGRVILETDITAESLNTSNLLATYALINRIDAARIDVDELFAREAFITQLTTSVIYNDTSLQMVIGKYGDLTRWFNFDDEDGFTIRKPAWTDKDGVEHPESIWKFRATETGIQIIRTDMPGEPILSAERERVSTPSIQMGDLLCKRTATGGWVWTDA